jgi:toxin-antitoxin system PIN domain toxin
VILLDANLLIYAYNTSLPQHRRARAWLQDALSRPHPVRIAWVSVLAFLRLTTNPRAFEQPLSINEAITVISEVLARPMVAMIAPGEQHWGILRELLSQAQVRGALVTDAHLAALAIEHGATLHTTDRDFERFPGLRTHNPLTQKE